MILARKVVSTSHWMDYGCFSPNVSTMTGLSDATQEAYLELIKNIAPDGSDALPWVIDSRHGILATTGAPDWNTDATRYWPNMYYRPTTSDMMKNRYIVLQPILVVRTNDIMPIICNPNVGPNYFGRDSSGVQQVADVDNTWRRDIRLNLDRFMTSAVGSTGGEPYVTRAKYTNYRNLMVIGADEIDVWTTARYYYVADGEATGVADAPPIFDDYNIDARVSGNILPRALQEGDAGYMIGWTGAGATATYQGDNTVSEGDGARITFANYSGSYAIQAGGSIAIGGTPATLTVSAYMRALGGSNLTNVVLQIDWATSTSYISSSSQSFTVSAAAMTQYSFTANRPGTATHFSIDIMRNATGGGTVDVDFVVVRTSGTLPTPSATSQARTGNWTKVLESNFDTFDTSSWSKAVEGGWNDKYGSIAAWDDSLVTLQNGRLRITAQYVNNQWRSGLILSKNKKTYTYGYFEARIKLTPAQGAFPAWWLFPNNPNGSWPGCGEIDILEHVGAVELTSAFGTIIYSRPGVGYERQGVIARGPVDLTTDFHTYGLLWEKSTDNRVMLRWFIDNVPFGMYDQSQWPAAEWGGPGSPFDYPYHMIINLAMGELSWSGEAPPSSSGAFIEVDWVKVWQRT